MNSSSASSSRTRRTMSAGGKARCPCGLDLIIFTAGTRENPNRRFLRCRRWQFPDCCGFFFWIDEPLMGRYAGQGSHAQVESDAMSLNSEIGNAPATSVHVQPDLNKKIIKLKKKLQVERFHKKIACLFTALAMMVAMWSLCIRKG